MVWMFNIIISIWIWKIPDKSKTKQNKTKTQIVKTSYAGCPRAIDIEID